MGTYKNNVSCSAACTRWGIIGGSSDDSHQRPLRGQATAGEDMLREANEIDVSNLLQLLTSIGPLWLWRAYVMEERTENV